MTGLQAENLTEAMRMGWQIRQHRDGTVFYIDFNFRDDRATDNLNLRRAIQAALDMEEMVYKVTKLPGYEPGVSLFPGWLMGEKDLLRREYPPQNQPERRLGPSLSKDSFAGTWTRRAAT